MRQPSTVAVIDLKISSVLGSDFIRLPRVYTQDSLPLDISEVLSHRMLLGWPHLHRLISKMPDRNENIPIGLLIGVNRRLCSRAISFHQSTTARVLLRRRWAGVCQDQCNQTIFVRMTSCHVSAYEQMNNGCEPSKLVCIR